MTSLACTVNELRTTRLVLHVPRYGCWAVDADFDKRVDVLTGRATVKVGDLTLVGTFSSRAGSFAQQSFARIVAGNGKHGNVLPARHYHNDAGVKSGLVVGDIIREAGEVAGSITEPATRLGVSYARVSGPAGRLLSIASPGGAWWVGSDGATNVGERPRVEVAEPYEVLAYDPRNKVATVATDKPAGIAVGSVLRARLDLPLLVEGIEMTVADGKARLRCWGSEVAS